METITEIENALANYIENMENLGHPHPWEKEVIASFKATIEVLKTKAAVKEATKALATANKAAAKAKSKNLKAFLTLRKAQWGK